MRRVTLRYIYVLMVIAALTLCPVAAALGAETGSGENRYFEIDGEALYGDMTARTDGQGRITLGPDTGTVYIPWVFKAEGAELVGEEISVVLELNDPTGGQLSGLRYALTARRTTARGNSEKNAYLLGWKPELSPQIIAGYAEASVTLKALVTLKATVRSDGSLKNIEDKATLHVSFKKNDGTPPVTPDKKPGESGEPEDPDKKPGESGEPDGPEDPDKKPGESGEPGGPEDPDKKPGESGEPGEPENPDKKPGESGEPGGPVDTDKKPGEPGEPGGPVDSDKKPGESGEPGGPENPDKKPGESGEPGDPEDPDKKPGQSDQTDQMDTDESNDGSDISGGDGSSGGEYPITWGDGGGGGDGGSAGGGSGEQTPEAAAKIRLIQCSVDRDEIHPGDRVTINATLKNGSSISAIKDLRIIYESETGEVLPVSALNSIYVDAIGAGNTYEISFSLDVGRTLTSDSQKITLSFEYTDKSASPLTSTENIFLKITPSFDFRVDQPSMAAQVEAFTAQDITVNVYNTGGSLVKNVICTLEMPGISAAGSAFGGDVAAGESKTITLKTLVNKLDSGDDANAYGAATGTIHVQYEDESGRAYAQDVSVMTRIIPPEGQTAPEKEVEKSSQWWVSIVCGLVAVQLAAFVIMGVHRRRKV